MRGPERIVCTNCDQDHQDARREINLITALSWLAGVVAAMLPKRWWPALDPYLPATDSAAVASIATILVAAAIGIPGFLHHASDQASANNRRILKAATRATRQSAATRLSDRDWGRLWVDASGLSLFTFIFLTPAGWAATYLGISGTWRAVAAAVDDPFGDPILTGLDALLLHGARTSRDRYDRNRRESLEGPDVRDRVVTGEQIGISSADLVILSARRKLWDIGTVVDTGGRWFRVTAIEERTIDGWLRTLYALNEHRDFEAFRRCVHYEMPPDAEKRDGASRFSS